jgi:hypothetical protein
VSKKEEYLTIRVTTYTKNTLEKLAKDQGRSMSGQVLYMLKQLLPQIVEPVEETDLESIQSQQRLG